MQKNITLYPLHDNEGDMQDIPDAGLRYVVHRDGDEKVLILAGPWGGYCNAISVDGPDQIEALTEALLDIRAAIRDRKGREYAGLWSQVMTDD